MMAAIPPCHLSCCPAVSRNSKSGRRYQFHVNLGAG
jgi:hypothetical protein